MRQIKYEEQKLSIRIKLIALWCSVMFFYLYGDYFKLYIPGETSKLVTGETLLNTPLTLFAASLLLAIPPLIIIASALAKATLVRVVNVIFGIVFTLIMLLIAVTSIDVQWSAYVFYALLESVFTIFIVWQAWNWPKTNI